VPECQLYRPARITKGGAISKLGLLVTPMLAKNISGVAYSIDVAEANDLGSNGFTYAVNINSHVTFVKLGVGSNGNFHNSLVVPIRDRAWTS
jgi:hypothetical protein